MDEQDAETFEKHSDELIRFATILVGPDAAGGRAVDAAVRAFSTTGWKDVDEPKAYLYRAVLNQARQANRSSRRRLRREAAWAARAHVEEPSHGRPEVIEAMRRLSARQRSVVYFAYWHDLHPSAIADLLATSPRTVHRDGAVPGFAGSERRSPGTAVAARGKTFAGVPAGEVDGEPQEGLPPTAWMDS